MTQNRYLLNLIHLANVNLRNKWKCNHKRNLLVPQLCFEASTFCNKLNCISEIEIDRVSVSLLVSLSLRSTTRIVNFGFLSFMFRFQLLVYMYLHSVNSRYGYRVVCVYNLDYYNERHVTSILYCIVAGTIVRPSTVVFQ